MTLRLLWNFLCWCPYQIWLLIRKFILFVIAHDRRLVTDDIADSLPIYFIFWMLTFMFGMILSAFACGALDGQNFPRDMGIVALTLLAAMVLHAISILVRIAFAAFLRDQQKYLNALKDTHYD